MFSVNLLRAPNIGVICVIIPEAAPVASEHNEQVESHSSLQGKTQAHLLPDFMEKEAFQFLQLWEFPNNTNPCALR